MQREHVSGRPPRTCAAPGACGPRAARSRRRSAGRDARSDAHPRRRGAAAVQLDARRQPRSRLGADGAATVASYVFSTPWRGCIRRAASSPSFVSSSSAGRVRVEPADREEPLVGADELDHGRPPVRVAHRRDDVRRLVQQDVGVRVGRDRARRRARRASPARRAARATSATTPSIVDAPVARRAPPPPRREPSPQAAR